MLASSCLLTVTKSVAARAAARTASALCPARTSSAALAYLSRSALTQQTTPMSTAASPASAALVKQLREMTGAPMMECKNALVAEGGDIQKAVDWLRKKGVAAASKKAGRAAAQGLVAVAVNETGNVGAIVEVRAC